MLFNSLEFALFFSVVYALYLGLQGNLRGQNLFLLAASYLFYARWDWRFLGLLFSTSLIAYACSLQISRSERPRRRRFFLVLSLACDLGVLFFFKYFNFFSENIVALGHWMGASWNPLLPRILLPVGISFYVFQSVSYVVDVYRREVPPARGFLDFSLFVAFFPHLVAGPIVRAKQLLPQFGRARRIDYDSLREGGFLILWGLFQKVVIADRMARWVESAYDRPGGFLVGPGAWLAFYAFAFQLYGDFAGYSNMARGLAKLMGFELSVNFRQPFFARNPKDFFERWHISLSTWFRDYLYRPLLGGKHPRLFRSCLAIILTVLASGLWHGASWTCVLFMEIYGVYRVMQYLLERSSRWRDARIWAPVSMVAFFHLSATAMIFLRSHDLSQSREMFHALAMHRTSGSADWVAFGTLAVALLAIEIPQFLSDETWAIQKWHPWARSGVYLGLILGICFYGVREGARFYYFQF